MPTNSDLPEIDERGEKILYVSWSRLLDYEQCHQLVKRKMAGQKTTIRDVRPFIHGTLADRAMRMWLEQDTPQLDGQMDSYIDDIWDQYTSNDTEKVKWRGNVKDDQDRVRALAKLTVNNVEPFLKRYVLPFEYQPELRFKVPMRLPDENNQPRTIILNGGIDIAVRNQFTGAAALFDLKSTQNESYVSGKILAQLMFYQIAWHLLTDTPYDKINAAFLTPATRVQFHPLSIAANDRRMLTTRIIKFAQGAWKNEWAPRDDETYCGWCVCKQWCDKFQTAEVLTDGKRRVSLQGTAQKRTGVETYNAKRDTGTDTTEGADTTN